MNRILEYDLDLAVWVRKQVGSGTLSKGENEHERRIGSFMRQALTKQLVFGSLFVANCVMQPCIQFARSVVVYFEKNREPGTNQRRQKTIM